MVDQVDAVASDAVDSDTETSSATLQSAFLDTLVQMGVVLMTQLVSDMADEASNE